MENENGRLEGGLQLPAHRMEDENVRVGRRQQDAQGMENGRVDGGLQLPAHRLDGDLAGE